uniref:Dirigent protein n=1 Tax=Oryza nivara TaxID=4536 RepID=A0A0E0I907_ORYNI
MDGAARQKGQGRRNSTLGRSDSLHYVNCRSSSTRSRAAGNHSERGQSSKRHGRSLAGLFSCRNASSSTVFYGAEQTVFTALLGLGGSARWRQGGVLTRLKTATASCRCNLCFLFEK